MPIGCLWYCIEIGSDLAQPSAGDRGHPVSRLTLRVLTCEDGTGSIFEI